MKFQNHLLNVADVSRGLGVYDLMGEVRKSWDLAGGAWLDVGSCIGPVGAI